ncbi:MAG: histidine kinase dimerization/phosphoacceptor domain -containing protein [Balneolaceae bacterium]|nr:histidine kinase dimerization/phosphoacceptor domain -containing protein [Balneolaceae bacterium]
MLLAAIGISTQYYNFQIKNQVVEESERAVEELEYSSDMGINLYASLLNAHFFLEQHYDGGRVEETKSGTQLSASAAKRKVDASLDSFFKNLDLVRSKLKERTDSSLSGTAFHRDIINLLRQLEDRVDIYKSLVNELFDLSSENFQDGREFLNVTVEPYFRSNLLPVIERVRVQTKRNLDNNIEILNARLDSAGRILALATIIALIISVGLAFYLYRSIATPLYELGNAAKQIGKGNLEERIHIDSNDEVGMLAAEFNRMAENLSKITFSKDYVDNIIKSMADALLVTDENGVIEKVNSAALSMLGYSESGLLGKPLSILFDSGEKPATELLDLENRYDNHETRFETRSGEQIHVSFSQSVMRNAKGNVKGLVCVASDITERKVAERQVKKSLKEKEILLTEIHHRVKNNLAVISGLLQMQIWETENAAAETALKDSQLRVQSIALVHEKLYQSENLSHIEFDKYIRDLLQAISGTYMENTQDISLQTELEPIALNINQAIPCSLLINELIVNAYKHAFQNRGNGDIWVKMHQQQEKINLTVCDNGVGVPDNFRMLTQESESLGMSIIETLVKQLNAEINIYNSEGAVFDITFNQDEVI